MSKARGAGRIRLIGLVFGFMLVCSTAALAARETPYIGDLDGARFKIGIHSTRYSVTDGREFRYRGAWEWEISTGQSEGTVTIHERGTDGEHDFQAFYGNGMLVWGQAASSDPASFSSTALCSIAFVTGRPGHLKIKGTKNVYDTPPADDYAGVMRFKGKQLKERAF